MDGDYSEIDTETNCLICSAEFLDQEDLKIHIIQYHIDKTNDRRFCRFCTKLYPDINEFVQHIKKEHLCFLKPCQYCTRLFNDELMLSKHEKEHKPFLLSQISCSNCSELFINKSDLERHEYEVHGQNEHGIMLQYCFPELSAAIKMNIRTFFFGNNDEKRYTCTCKFTTTDSYDYWKHINNLDCKSFVCDICCNVYCWKSKLRHHIKSHLQVKTSVKQQCKKCGKTFDQAKMKSHTEECKAMYCAPCKITFDSIDEYAAHVTTHPQSQVQCVICKYCWRPIIGSEALQKHIDRTHKPHMHLYKYYCLPCNRVFKHPKLLFGHFFSKHKDLQPYTCKICNKKFKMRRGFTLHIKLDHKSIGFVEFDENFHVFFTDKKSKTPFEPRNVDMVDKPRNYEKDASKSTKLDTIQYVDVNMKNKPVAALGKDLIDESVDENQKSLKISQDNIESVSAINCKDDSNSKNKRRKTTRSKTKISQSFDLLSDDSDTPLCQFKKKRKLKSGMNRYRARAKKFVCNKCDRNCFTYDNYHRHMSMHRKNEEKTCVKCQEKFKTKEALGNHMKAKHSHSKLTETLKQLLDKRKSAVNVTPSAKEVTNLFKKTIKRVSKEETNSHATIIVVEHDKSPVKKFLESFKPENSESHIRNVTSVSFKKVTVDKKEPLIKMSKFTPEPVSTNPGLRMPVKFKEEPTEKHRVSIKLVRCEYLPPGIKFDSEITVPDCDSQTESCVDETYTEETYTEDITDTVEFGNNDKADSIPEVGEEVQLDCDENGIKIQSNTKSIILNDLPFKNIRIGHLSPSAPFYKIVKIKDVLQEKPKEAEIASKPLASNITLPNGVKLVTVNPLAHLLDKARIQTLEKAASNRTQNKDFGEAIAKAMTSLHKTKAKTTEHKQAKTPLL